MVANQSGKIFEYVACEYPSLDLARLPRRCGHVAFVWCRTYDALLCHARASDRHRGDWHVSIDEASAERRALALVRLPLE